MAILAFWLMWAFARLLLQLSWALGVIAGYALVSIVRHASRVQRSSNHLFHG